jgi:hypothetical protein
MSVGVFSRPCKVDCLMFMFKCVLIVRDELKFNSSSKMCSVSLKQNVFMLMLTDLHSM